MSRNISLLRRALSDDARTVIVTVARIGYRFAAPVVMVDGAVASRRTVGEPVQVSVDGGQGHGAQMDAAGEGRDRRCLRSERGGLIVGRDAVLDTLGRGFQSARHGPGRLMGIAGEPGIGKTTVVEAFLDGLDSPCLALRGRCSERLAGTEPHLSILEALDEVIAARPSLVDVLRRTAPTWFRHVAPLFSVPLPVVDREPDASPGNAATLMRELTLFLEEISRAQPVVIFIDDLQWADVSTVDVLAHLAPRLARIRALIIVAYRQHELAHGDHPFRFLRNELRARGQFDEVHLGQLGRDAVRQYIESTLAGESVSADLPALVYQRTEGNPLFMTDLVRYFRQVGFPAPSSTSRPEVPDSVRALIERARASASGDPTAALHRGRRRRPVRDGRPRAGHRLRNGGRRGAAVSGSPGVRTRDTRARSRAPRWKRIGEISIRARALSGRAGGCGGPSRRIEWARLIAEALAQHYRSRTEIIAGQAAVLFEHGRDFWQASHFFLVACRTVAGRFAFQEAVALANRGLACLASLAAQESRELLRRELDLTVAGLVPLAFVEGYASQAVEARTRRLVRLGESLEDVPATAAALGATWIVRMVRGECRAAEEAGCRLAALAIRAGSDVLLMNAHVHVQIASHHLGDFKEAQERAAAVFEMGSRVPHPERCISIFDPLVASLAESSRALWITGHLARALEQADAAVALGRDLRHPDSHAFAQSFHSKLNGYRGEWVKCLESADAGLTVAIDCGSAQALAWNHCMRGWALAHLGQVEDGLSELEAGLEASERIMGKVAFAQFSAMVAQVLLLRQDVAGAEAWLARGISFMESHDDCFFEAEVYRLSAQCLARRGQRAAAVARLGQAIDVARAQGACTFELLAGVDLAGLDEQAGSTVLRAVLATFPEPEPWPVVEEARRIVSRADALGAARAPRA